VAKKRKERVALGEDTGAIDTAGEAHDHDMEPQNKMQKQDSEVAEFHEVDA
jgi:hypothetical protein